MKPNLFIFKAAGEILYFKAMSEETANAIEVFNNALVGREIPSAINTQKLLEDHAKVTNGKVRTRFPPEPNG